MSGEQAGVLCRQTQRGHEGNVAAAGAGAASGPSDPLRLTSAPLSGQRRQGQSGDAHRGVAMPSGPDEDQKRVQEATRTLALPRHQRERFKPGRPSSERARPALGSRCVNPRVARLSWDPVALLAHVIWGGDSVLPSPRQKTSHGEPDLPRGLLARGIFRQLYLPKFLSKGTKKTRPLFLSYCDIATQSKAIDPPPLSF